MYYYTLFWHKDNDAGFYFLSIDRKNGRISIKKKIFICINQLYFKYSKSLIVTAVVILVALITVYQALGYKRNEKTNRKYSHTYYACAYQFILIIFPVRERDNLFEGNNYDIG